MKPEALTVGELAVLRRIGDRIRIAATLYPYPADRPYSYAEVIPYGTLVPDHVRSIVRAEVEGMERAAVLAEYVYDEVKIDGVPYRQWVDNPEAMR